MSRKKDKVNRNSGIVGGYLEDIQKRYTFASLLDSFIFFLHIKDVFPHWVRKSSVSPIGCMENTVMDLIQKEGKERNRRLKIYTCFLTFFLGSLSLLCMLMCSNIYTHCIYSPCFFCCDSGRAFLINYQLLIMASKRHCS